MGKAPPTGPPTTAGASIDFIFFLTGALFLAADFFLGAAFFLATTFLTGAFFFATTFFLATLFFFTTTFFFTAAFFLGAAFFFAVFFPATFFTVFFFIVVSLVYNKLTSRSCIDPIFLHAQHAEKKQSFFSKKPEKTLLKILRSSTMVNFYSGLAQR
ncbi:MAG: hypothetical protein FJZ58_02565 [Chlamydiae bacterium]|nr:hypothetical protein [Chlamydiota bacterium]